MTDDNDVASLLRDLAHIIDDSHAVARFSFLSGSLLLDAANEIERLQISNAEKDAEIARLSKIATY
jgi:hypothetical protein